jgi:hypothetical protein
LWSTFDRGTPGKCGWLITWINVLNALDEAFLLSQFMWISTTLLGFCSNSSERAKLAISGENPPLNQVTFTRRLPEPFRRYLKFLAI